MTNSEYIYTIYIKATPEKVWNSITNPEFTRQYWGHENVSDWKKGSQWQHVISDGKRSVKLVGEVPESEPPKRLVLTWVEPGDASPKHEYSRVTFEIEAIEAMVRLRVIHSNLKAGSEMAGKISSGWPRVLSSLKSFLETGRRSIPGQAMSMTARNSDFCATCNSTSGELMYCLKDYVEGRNPGPHWNE